MAGRWQRLPLRTRLVALGMVGVLIGFAIGGVALVLVLERTLIGSMDNRADETASGVVSYLEADALPDPIPLGSGATLVQVLDEDGDITAASLGGDRMVPLLRPTEIRTALGGERLTIEGAPNGYDGRLRVTVVPSGGYTIIVAVSTDEMKVVGWVAVGLSIALSAFGAAIALVLWWAIGRTLRPVEAARARQRAFIADAAHELRSPLTNMRTELEVAQRVGAPDGMVDDLLTDVERLSRMTEDLLLLARLDDASVPFRPAVVDLRALLTDLVSAYTEARVPVTLDVDGDVFLNGDADGLHRALTNLVDNAVRHASTGVEINVGTLDGQLLLSVIDDGPGIPADERTKVFDRFTRLDDARSRDSGGTGLGLPIVAQLVKQHGGTITLWSARPGRDNPGLRAEIRLPG